MTKRGKFERLIIIQLVENNNHGLLEEFLTNLKEAIILHLSLCFVYCLKLHLTVSPPYSSRPYWIPLADFSPQCRDI